jgi:O-succinylbenzoic acid--CoA ligase
MTEAASQIATQPLAALAHPYQPFPIPLLPLWRAEVSAENLLRIAGPALFSGALIARDGAWIYHPRDGEWHETRDRVALENHAITPLGRADTMVKVLGELVDPEAIEREIAALSGGKLALGSFAVVAIPDARAEHALVPVFDRGVDKEDVENLLKLHAAQLPGWLRLRPIVILDPLPRSPMGKPLRARISEMVRALIG